MEGKVWNTLLYLVDRSGSYSPLSAGVSGVVLVNIMHLSKLVPTSPHPGQGGEFSLFGMADLPQGSGY